MLHRGIKIAYVAAMIVSAVMAFVVLRNFDEATMAGRSFVVSVDETPDAAGSERVAEMVQAFALDRQINVGRQYFDQRDKSRAFMYLAVGDPGGESSRWLTDGYPAFSRELKVDVRPYRDLISATPNGQYFVYGAERDAADLLAEFGTLGYEGIAEPLLSLNAIRYFGEGPLALCLLLMALVVILAVGSAVFLNAKAYGVQRLQGISYIGVLRRDLTQLAAFCAMAVAAVVTVTLASLYLYNRLNQVHLYALIALVFLAFFVVLALGTHVVTLILAHRTPIRDAVKGEISAGWAIVGGYVLRVASVTLTLSIAVGTIGAGLVLLEQRTKDQVWAAMSDAYFLRLGGAPLNPEQERAIDAGIGGWIRDADSRNEVSLGWYMPDLSTVPGPAPREALVVNNRYLVRHDIRDAAGVRVEPGTENAIRVLIPQRYSAERDAISAAVTEWEQSMRNRRVVSEAPPIRMGTTGDQQRVVSYSTSASGLDPLLRDPIVIVVTGASGVISDDEYVSAASRGEVLFEDPDAAMRGFTDAGIAPYVLGLSPFAGDAAEEYRNAGRRFGLQVSSLVAAVAVLLATAITVSVVYCRRNAQTLFAKYISGWSFLRTHGWILAGEGAIALALVLWTWQSTVAATKMYERPGSPPPPADLEILGNWAPVVAVGVASLSLGLILVSLLRTNAKFVRAHVATLS